MRGTLSVVTAVLLFSSLSAVADEEILRQEQKIEDFESQLKEGQCVLTDNKNTKIALSGGISAGYFYTNNPGKEATKNRKSKFVLTNALINLSISPKNYPFSVDLGLGGTATPSLVDNPVDSAPQFDIEYADLSLTPIQNLTLEIGLLQPNAGYEDTYTFNNKNITVGVMASQQPYNAYGARVTYSLNDIDIYASYYKDRLDSTEYEVEGYGNADHSYEVGVGGDVFGLDSTLYYYNINRIRSLVGIALKKEFENLYLAVDADYWRWNDNAKKFQNIKDNSAYGISVYVSPKVNEKVEIPVRLEYINQGKSKIYIDSEDADNIYAITVTPTYHLTDDIYVRAEGGYVYAQNGFEDNNGQKRDSKCYVSFEVGYAF
ncbi:outer membrane beta-barrel protein [Desulfurobacterium thermolithotrophum]|uniref:outer membrane beta-barrel protein n=1 Tax=Desulfurobacterium thermolithotrophum TaxID=64160 RepID=UPI0013D17533|nr:outer membrane beta-barrel protein [Desulfurobacterium thermolithotrophum]